MAPDASASADQQLELVLSLGPDGLPTGGASTVRLEATRERVYQVIAAFDRYPGRVPMIHRAERRGSQVDIDLRFRVALVTVKFNCLAALTEEPGRFLELRHLAGEPRGLRIRHDLAPLDDGRATRLTTFVGFEVHSLGWLVKLVLRHHPEVQFGIFAGTASALQHALKRALGASHLAPIA